MIPQQEKIWFMLGLMMVTPLLFMVFVPEPFATIGMIGTNLGMLFYIRKFYKNIAGSLLGSKTSLVCSACQGNKFSNDGTCKRCGSKNRRLG